MSQSAHITPNGALLESKVASDGTVRLTVDHANISYYVDFEETFTWPDSREILAYLHEHGFEIMDEDEAPFERLSDGGFRAWACHSEGTEFGAASVSLLAALSVAAGVAIPVIQGFMRFFEPLAAA